MGGECFGARCTPVSAFRSVTPDPIRESGSGDAGPGVREAPSGLSTPLWPALALLIALKIGMDLRAHTREHAVVTAIGGEID
jgi:hypothetical protein